MTHLTQTGFVNDLNARSLAARPWLQPGFQFRPRSQHDGVGHAFRADRPFFGWVEVQVGDIDLTMYTNNDDGVAGVYHTFGPDAYESVSVAAWLEIARTARHVADIGAFTGLFGMLAQKVSPEAQVLAVEPNGAVRARLMMNLVVNGFYPRLEVVPYAVSEKVSVLSLHIGLGADLLETGGSIIGANAHTTRTETVAAISLDALLQQAAFTGIDLLKIDVEGAEVEALRGATRTLAQGPTLFLEIQSPALLDACYSVLAEHGYRIFGIDDDHISLIPYDGANTEAWMKHHVGQRVLNYLCVTRDEHVALANAGLARIRTMMEA